MIESLTGEAHIPQFGDTVREVDGIFSSDAALQEAITRLELAGFDRADLSLPHAAGASQPDSPDQGADDPDTEEDFSQRRTLEASLSGAVAAMAASLGMAATGAAVAPALATALAAGLGITALAEAVMRVGARSRHAHREMDAAHGDLVLTVHLSDPARLEVADRAMLTAGGMRVESVERAVATGSPAAELKPADDFPLWIPGVRLAYRARDWGRIDLH